MICPEFVFTWEVMTFILSIMSRMRLRMPSSWNRSCRFLKAFKNFCRSSWLDGVGPIFHFVTINVALFAQTKACYTLPLHAFLGRSVYFHTAQQCQIATKSSMQLMHLVQQLSKVGMYPRPCFTIPEVIFWLDKVVVQIIKAAHLLGERN